MIFNMSDVPDEVIIPDGEKVPLICIKSEFGPNKGNTCMMLSIQLQEMDSEEQTIHFQNFITAHQEKRALNFGLRALGKYCSAIGLQEIRSADDVVATKVIGVFGVRVNKDTKDKENYIKTFEPYVDKFAQMEPKTQPLAGSPSPNPPAPSYLDVPPHPADTQERLPMPNTERQAPSNGPVRPF